MDVTAVVRAVAVSIFAVFMCVIVAPFLVTLLLGRFNDGYTVEGGVPYVPNVPQLPYYRNFDGTAVLNRLSYIHEGYESLDLFAELEEYIVMVVAAEMPALFHEQALKAQAVAARTYAVNQLLGDPAATFSTIEQVYTTEEALRALWGERFDYFMARVRNSVEATRGKIMVFDGEPILAVFHAMSAGQTEVAENVWRNPRPYLVSVFSSSYYGVNGFAVQKTFSAADMARLLGGNISDRLTITRVSAAGYVLEAAFGGTTFTGRQIRETLNLRSTNFDVTRAANGDTTFTTRGHGHGVGMSQHGANIMAQNGANYIEILLHYYYGVEFGVLQ